MAASEPSRSPVLPPLEVLAQARSTLCSALPESGRGLQFTQDHLYNDIVPALSGSSRSPNYYGFVTGGATPAAAFADHLVTEHDQSLAVHLPNDSIATDVEDSALRMLTDLLRLKSAEWQHRIFTTGATASNVLGLACGREFVVREAARRSGREASIAEHGIAEAMKIAGIDSIQILTTVPHSSLRKAASIVGLGRAAVRDTSSAHAPHRFDMGAVKAALQRPNTASIIAVSCSEVNTGLFATDLRDLEALRSLCTEYNAWLHVDAAFGLLARVLPPSLSEFKTLRSGVAGLDLADSITGDAHKLLNVPYDCGIFLSRHLDIGVSVFQNTGAVYLTTTSNSIPSPLDIGIENSRRFRALPVYANLLSYGQDGYREMLLQQIGLARAIATYMISSASYDLLPAEPSPSTTTEERLQSIYIIVLFRARDPQINANLVQRINQSRTIYVSGTQWDGQPAARFAVSNWQVDIERDRRIIEEVLESVIAEA